MFKRITNLAHDFYLYQALAMAIITKLAHDIYLCQSLTFTHHNINWGTVYKPHMNCWVLFILDSNWRYCFPLARLGCKDDCAICTWNHQKQYSLQLQIRLIYWGNLTHEFVGVFNTSVLHSDRCFMAIEECGHTVNLWLLCRIWSWKPLSVGDSFLFTILFYF